VGGYAEGLNTIETGTKEKFSKRALYSEVKEPNGGVWTTKAVEFWQNNGMFYEKDFADYDNGNPPSEAFMSQKTNPTHAQREEAKKYLCGKYTTWKNTNFEIYRQAIKAGKGALVVVYGSNPSWASAYIEKPPLKKEDCPWSHQILLVNSKPVIKNGKEYLKFRNSWNGWGDKGYGYIGRDYLESGLCVCPLTVVDVPNETYIKLTSQIQNILEQMIRILKEKIAKLIK